MFLIWVKSGRTAARFHVDVGMVLGVSVMLEYLRSFGGVSFEDRALNDADRLAFAQLVYLPFDPEIRNVPLAEALAKVDFENRQPSQVRFGFQHRDDRELCRLADCARYAPLKLLDFTCEYNPERERQFAAMALSLPDGGVMIVYRGTDNTLAGWKEDFNLAFMDEIPSQGMACAYADEFGRNADFVELCGHSKGGNLALYAAVFCEETVQAKIRCAVSFDGPGLSRSVIESKPFQRVSDRLRLRIPKASLVGLLFYQPEDVRPVECRGLSITQHYPYFWRTEGMDLKYAEGLSPAGRKLGLSVCGAIEKMPLHTRERLVAAMYEIVSETGAETLNDLVNGWAVNTKAVVRKLLHTDIEDYALLIRILAAFWLSVAEAFGVTLRVDVNKWFRDE